MLDEWHSVCNSTDEPTSSLQEFEDHVATARILLETTPPAFRRTVSDVEKAIKICQSEPFMILDKRNRDRLARCSVRFQRLQTQIDGLRDEIVNRQKVVGFTVPLSGKRYKIEAEEVRNRAMNAAYNLASAKVCSGAGERISLTILEKVAERARQTRPRYFAAKVSILESYLEAGAHAGVIPKVVWDVVAELRFQGMAKRDIRNLVSFFGRGTPRCQIDLFTKSLTLEREHTVYLPVPGIAMQAKRTSLQNLELLRNGTLPKAPDSPLATMLDRFVALNAQSVTAGVTVSASAPALAIAHARQTVDATASLVAYLTRLSGPTSDMQQTPSVVFSDNQLVQAGGLGAEQDRLLHLPSSLSSKLRKVLSVSGAILPPTYRTELQERVLTSMHWYRLGVTSQTLEERFVDHAIALEVLLSAKETEQDKKRILADRATRLRHILRVGRNDHQRLIKHLYSSRSDLVHAGLYRSRTLLQDSQDLERAVLSCLFAGLEAISNGCTDLVGMMTRVERTRDRLRKRRIRKSRLTANQRAAFRGSLLHPSGKTLADVRGTLTLVDEGGDGYAYHELGLSDAKYKKPFSISSADQFWFAGRAAGCCVELRDGWIADGGSPSMFFAVSAEARSFTYRAFDNVVFNDCGSQL